MTRFTELVGCQFPLQLAGMGGVGTTELAAAVVDAGGCAMVPDGVEPASGTCGVNFLMPFKPSLEHVREVAGRTGLVEFFYADPRQDFVDAAHDMKALVGWQVGSLDEAVAAAAVGCDFVVAQGSEAGGHIRGNQAIDVLLPMVLAAVTVPVVAAGGVATAERFAALIRAGADAVRVGTRFVTSPESAAHPDYVADLLAANGTDTVETEWFCDGWDHAPHRVLRSALVAAQNSGWRNVTPPTRGQSRGAADMAMYAGMGVGFVTTSQPARDVVADLVRLL